MDPINGGGLDAGEGGRYRGTDPHFESVPVVGTKNHEGFCEFYNIGTEVPTKEEKEVGHIAPTAPLAGQSNVIALGSTVGLMADIHALAIRVSDSEPETSVVDIELALGEIAKR